MYQFTSANDVERIVQDRDQDASEYLVFRHIPYDAFLQLDTPHCRLLYIHNSQILRLRMPSSRTHNTAYLQFANIVAKKYMERGIFDDIGPEGTGLMDMTNVSKQPDACWGPIDEDYVTCTLEVGLSETIHHLVLDAHIWLESADSHVSQVIIIDIAPDHPHLTIQKWELRTRNLRSTRSSRPREAIKTEEVEVSLVDNVPTASGCLRLSSTKILEHPPRPDTQEEDIVFTPDDLAAIARHVWRRQNLIPREMARA